MAHQDRTGAQPRDELLQAGEAVEVEVVGGLVQQEDVIAAEQQRGQPGAGRLATGEAGHRPVEIHLQPEGGGGLLGPFVEVGRAEGEPALQPGRVGVVRARRPLDQRLGRGVERRLSLGHSGAAREEGPYGLPRPPLGLLWQMPDGRPGRAQPQLPLLGRVEPREQPQQRRLPRAIGSDEPDHLTGGHDEVEPGEEGAVAVSGGEVLGDEGGTHKGPDFIRCPPVGRNGLPPGRGYVAGGGAGRASYGPIPGTAGRPASGVRREA